MPEDLTPTAGPVGATAAEPTITPLSPPGYQLLDEIGRGGMGVVYRARDTALDRDVAVKLLADRYPANSPAAQRFLSEARITGQLQHPGIPAVHQVGTLADGRPFLAMKLIKGSTLETLLKQRTDPAAERGRLLAIFEAICQAVGYAHAHRVIHRDLKPANVMVGAFGEVQVMDWGLAKVLGEQTPGTVKAPAAEETRAWTQVSPTPEVGSHTQAGSLVGTPAFIPPEQAVGEIERVNERSDMFGLGALLAVILTGQPPYVGETFESVRVQSVRGKLEDCFARLDASGAEPELVALCKRCLAFEPADRPADAGAAAAAVAELRAAADERARRAELERVRVEGEQATAQARSAERRKRRRLVIGAAAVLAVAALGGLAAVLAVQRRANRELEGKNQALAEQQQEVEDRFELAQKAIATFHTGVSEDALLKNPGLTELRTKLLKEAAGFYGDLEKLLAGRTDVNSRRLLASGYFQLGELTDKIGDKREALAVHRKALALRRELAALPDAGAEVRLDVPRSLLMVGRLLEATGDRAAALAAHEEARDLAERLAAEDSADAIRMVLARSYLNIGTLLWRKGQLAEALAAYEKALDIGQKPADAGPAAAQFQSLLESSHNNIGIVLADMGRPVEALVAYEKSRDIGEKLTNAYPTVTQYQINLAQSYNNIGWQLSHTGRPTEALAAYLMALAIKQKLADANPAVTDFQTNVAFTDINIGRLMRETGRLAEAVAAYERAQAIYQKLADANPAVTDFQTSVASSQMYIGNVLEWAKPAEALAAFEKARAIYQKVADAKASDTLVQWSLAIAHSNIGLMHARQKRFVDAFAALDQSVALMQRLADKSPDNTDFKSSLGSNNAVRGWARVRAGQPAEAAADLRRAVELLSKDTALQIDHRFQRSLALAVLAGLVGDAKSGMTAAEAAAFADQSVAALRDAIQAGWAVPEELKEPEFDLLRKRDDFRKLQKEVEARAAANRAGLNKQPEPDKN